MKKIVSCIIISVLCVTSCSSINTKSDYSNATASFGAEDISGAIDKLPGGEGKTFITIMEKTHLSLLAGNPDISRLEAYSAKIDDQIRFKISRGLKSFFFVETPEGYYASEHEIIWMHFLLCWGYALKKDDARARVEVKKATNLLSSEFSSEGRFDDAFMRMICGIMWALCGEWEDARTDFRRAFQIDKSLVWLKPLINAEDPPASLILIMCGTGYEPYWNPKMKGLVRGMRDVSFKGSGLKQKIIIPGADASALNLFITPDSSNWYMRHEIRNNDIAESIDDLKYTERFGFSSGKMASHVAMGIGGGLLIFTLVGGAGLTLAALGLYAQSGELFGAGLAVFLAGGYKGVDFAGDQISTAKENYAADMNPAEKYRFVRFLPEYAWLGWASKEMDLPLHLKSNEKSIELKNSYTLKNNGVSITFGYYPDVK